VHWVEMGKLLSKIFGNKEMRILMLGLDAAGKTSILYGSFQSCHRHNTFLPLYSICQSCQFNNTHIGGVIRSP